MPLIRSLRWLPLAAAVAAALPLASPAPAPAQSASASDADAEYTRVIRARAEKIVASLKLDDPAKTEQVTTLLTDQYRALRAIHDPRDAKIKQARDSLEGAERDAAVQKIRDDAMAKLVPLNEAFVGKLQAILTPEQVEGVKNGLTYNVLNVTYDGFLDMLPQLTDGQKQHIRSELLKAREIAMVGGSSEEKHAAFGKIKGRINNYLSKQGYDLKQASKDWAERRKAQQQTPTTRPTN
jgi:hypothetical protein